MNVFEGTTLKHGRGEARGPLRRARRRSSSNYVVIRPGDLYSQRLIAQTEEALRNRLSEDGFAFAEVTAVPSVEPGSDEIALTFQIEPNARTYVRRINFLGVERTNDEVLRREMRQLEGAVLSNARGHALRGAPAAPAVHQIGGVRDEAGRRARRTSSTSR